MSLPSKGAALRLQLEAESYGVDFNDHYLRNNGDGSVTVTVFGTQADIDGLGDAGYDIGATIEGPAIWRERIADRQAAVRAEDRAIAAAEGEQVGTLAQEDEVVILRVDYFENPDGRFLSVEAKTRDGSAAPSGGTYVVRPSRCHGTPGRARRSARRRGSCRQRGSGHHSGHVHRAPRAGPHRRAGDRVPAAAQSSPCRVQHR